MVRHAFRVLTEDRIKTRLIAFSDDMDGLRKAPDNVPNRDMVLANLGKPLTEVPDPFGEYESFAAHNNARLRRFLDGFGFDYEFASSTDYYRSGRFDAALLHMLRRFDAIQEIMLPSLREERAATYSPFLPIHPVTRVVMQVPLTGMDADKGMIRWTDPATGEDFETPVTGGHCKLQWKPDWAMRWYALGVDYEMAGKDLIDSVKLSSRIVRALGGEPPDGFNYELFLDEKGQKISKSKGNGLTIDEWLTYASPESLALFMFQKPSAAKRLHFDVIPRTVDDYLGFLDAYPRQEWKERLGNPVWHIHSGAPPEPETLARRGRQRSLSPCCSIWRRSPTATIRRCSGASCGDTRRRRRRRRIPVSISSSATRSPISAISSRRRSVYRAADDVERGGADAGLRPARRPARRRDARKKSRRRSTTSRGQFRAIRI